MTHSQEDWDIADATYGHIRLAEHGDIEDMQEMHQAHGGPWPVDVSHIKEPWRRYQEKLYHFLRSGQATDAALREVSSLLAASTDCDPSLLDVEMNEAFECECETLVWWADDSCWNCGTKVEQ